jgi:hypothetical protein
MYLGWARAIFSSEAAIMVLGAVVVGVPAAGFVVAGSLLGWW